MALPSNPVDRLVAKIKNNLGRTGDSNINDMVLDWVNDGQRTLCNRTNFWFMHATSIDTWTQGQTTQPLPTTFKSIDYVFYAVPGVLGFTELDPMDLEDYQRRYDDTTQAAPEAYLIRESPTNDYILRSIPDKTYTIYFGYWGFLADLVAAGSTNLLLSHYDWVLEYYATHRGFKYLQLWDDAQQWKNDFEAEYLNMVAENAVHELPDEFILHARPDVKGTTIGTFRGRTSFGGLASG